MLDAESPFRQKCDLKKFVCHFIKGEFCFGSLFSNLFLKVKNSLIGELRF